MWHLLGESGQLQAESGKKNLHAHDFEIQPIFPYLGYLFVFLIHEGHEDKTGSGSPKVGPME